MRLVAVAFRKQFPGPLVGGGFVRRLAARRGRLQLSALQRRWQLAARRRRLLLLLLAVLLLLLYSLASLLLGLGFCVTTVMVVLWQDWPATWCLGQSGRSGSTIGKTDR